METSKERKPKQLELFKELPVTQPQIRVSPLKAERQAGELVELKSWKLRRNKEGIQEKVPAGTGFLRSRTLKRIKG